MFITLPIGMRLIRLNGLGAMLAQVKHAPDRLSFHPSGAVSESADIDLWMPVEIENGQWAAMPGPEFCSRLYRGQNARYLPCRALRSWENSGLSVLAILEWLRLKAGRLPTAKLLLMERARRSTTNCQLRCWIFPGRERSQNFSHDADLSQVKIESGSRFQAQNFLLCCTQWILPYCWVMKKQRLSLG